MSDTLLIILIALMVVNLIVLSGAVAGLAIALRKQLPDIRQRIDTVQARVVTLLDETIPTLQGTHKALDEAARTPHEAAATIENLHHVTDNIRHKLEVADAIVAKVRKVPEKTARMLGRLIHQTFRLGGRVLARLHRRILQFISPKSHTTINRFPLNRRRRRPHLTRSPKHTDTRRDDRCKTMMNAVGYCICWQELGWARLSAL